MPLASATTAAASAPELFHLPGFDEPFSAISHLVAAAIFLVLGYLLLERGRGDRTRMSFLSVYVVSCVTLFIMSSAYHMTVRGSAANEVMGRLDHAAIFLLIAGTFTPCYGILYRGSMRLVLLASVWVPALVGITIAAIHPAGLSDAWQLALDLGLGWSGLIITWDVCRRQSFAFVRPLVVGGLLTSVFAVTQSFGWPVLIPHVVHAPRGVFTRCGADRFDFSLAIHLANRQLGNGIGAHIDLPRPISPAGRLGARTEIAPHSPSPLAGEGRGEGVGNTRIHFSIGPLCSPLRVGIRCRPTRRRGAAAVLDRRVALAGDPELHAIDPAAAEELVPRGVELDL